MTLPGPPTKPPSAHASYPILGRAQALMRCMIGDCRRTAIGSLRTRHDKNMLRRRDDVMNSLGTMDEEASGIAKQL